MSEILAYLPTYSPNTEADTNYPRPSTRLTNQQIVERLKGQSGTLKPWMYCDAIDSILNTRPDIHLVVGDGRSTDSIRAGLLAHNKESHLETCELTLHQQSPVPAEYTLELYPEKMSQWIIFNDILNKYSTPETKYFVYTSSDVIWLMDWVAEAIKAFERDPKLQILFPCVNRGDPNLPCQIAPEPRDIPPIKPPFQQAARAPVLNAYAMIFRMDFLRAYGGYPTAYRNCYTESFLHYMCKAMGGEMRVLPRGWCFHWGEGDSWSGPGGYYNYSAEKCKFEAMMNDVQMAEAMGRMSVDFLKRTLYLQE